MNRIKLSPLASSPATPSKGPKAPKTPAALFSIDKTSARSDQETSVFAPLHYEKKYAYPLVIWLHSDGQKSAQLQTWMEQLSMRNYVGIAPQASVGNFECGYYWEQDYDSIATAYDSVNDAIRTAQTRFNINPRRIFLVGSEGGGTMALRVGFKQPDRFAGLVSLNGALPLGDTPLAHWHRCRTTPVFWGHHLDPADPGNADRMCSDFQQLYASGFLNLSAREYPTSAHLEQLAPAAVNQWIMEQIQSAIL